MELDNCGKGYMRQGRGSREKRDRPRKTGMGKIADRTESEKMGFLK